MAAMKDKNLTLVDSRRLLQYGLPLAIILFAAFLRLYQLPTLPPGLNFDEAGNGVAAFDILNGAPQLWWRIGGGKEPVWPYLLAGWTAIWGNSALTLRLPAALIGSLTVAAVYPLTIRLFQGHHRQPRLIALLTMLGIAFSAWHLHFSRLGFRAILLPLFTALAFYFLWTGMSATLTPHSSRLSQLISFILATLFVALTIYSYLAGRLLFFIPLLFFALQWPLAKLHRPQIPSSAPNPNNYLLFTIYYLLLTLFFISPLIIYFSYHPADFIARAGAVSIFNPDWNNGDLLGTVWHTVRLTAGTFLGLTGDANPLVNLPHQPALPLFLAPFFLLGFFTTMLKALRSNSPSSLFLLIWWVVMLLPAILAPEGAPHHLRLLGTLIPTYIFVALGFVTIINLPEKLFSPTLYTLYSTRRLPYLLPLTCYLLLATQTYNHYFIRWPNSADFTLPFDLYAVELANDIAQRPAMTGYVLPMDIRAGIEARHYTLDYLLGTYQPKPYTYIPVDERNAEKLLAEAAHQTDTLQVIRWIQDKHHEADAKEIITFLLETNGRQTASDSHPVYEIETYTFPPHQSDPKPDSLNIFTMPSISQPIAATFDGLLRLDASYVQPETSPDDWLAVALTFAPVGLIDADYKASIRLISPTGERIQQKDRVLLHNFHQGTSLWPPETVNEYYLLPIPPATPPGDYKVVVVIYHPETQAPLVADGLVEVPVGTTRVK